MIVLLVSFQKNVHQDHREVPPLIKKTSGEHGLLH